MHSLGTRQLNIDTNTQLLKANKWKAFKNFSQICRDMSFESYINDFLSERKTYENGNVTEYIKYHPTKPGEWSFSKYVYF